MAIIVSKMTSHCTNERKVRKWDKKKVRKRIGFMPILITHISSATGFIRMKLGHLADMAVVHTSRRRFDVMTSDTVSNGFIAGSVHV